MATWKGHDLAAVYEQVVKPARAAQGKGDVDDRTLRRIAARLWNPPTTAEKAAAPGRDPEAA